MKRIINLLAVTGFLGVVILFGCGPNTALQQEFHLQHADEIISAFNAYKPESEWTKRKEGKVSINVSDTIIQIKNDIANDPSLTIYFLQIDRPVQGFDSMELGLSEVIFLEKHLIVNSLSRNETFLFSLANETPPDYLDGTYFTHQFFGYAIGQHTINKTSFPNPTQPLELDVHSEF